jgi:stage II sporulation protein AA (anti-sigma F factor antagonist)
MGLSNQRKEEMETMIHPKTPSDEQLSMQLESDTLTVCLRGEIDHHRAATLRSIIDDAICRYRPHVLRLDMSGIAFMDSSGLGLVMGRRALLLRMEGELVVQHPAPAALRMLHLAGMERIVRIE